MSESYDLSQALPFLIGGLALFLFSISRLSEEMKAAFGAKARAVIARYTRHLLSAVLIGGAVTVALGSSSAAIIIALIFINAGSLTFQQAIGIIMGANIGTTFSSQLIAPFVQLVEYVTLSPGIETHLANAHLLFNLLGVLVFLPLVGPAERALNRLVPERGGARDEQVYETPADRAQQVS